MARVPVLALALVASCLVSSSAAFELRGSPFQSLEEQAVANIGNGLWRVRRWPAVTWRHVAGLCLYYCLTLVPCRHGLCSCCMVGAAHVAYGFLRDLCGRHSVRIDAPRIHVPAVSFHLNNAPLTYDVCGGATVAGFEVAMPVNASLAVSQGWYPTSSSCDSSQGLVYSQSKSGATEDKPLQLMYTQTGMFAGVRVTIYGDSWTSKIGPAAQPSLVKGGYWIVQSGAKDTWYITVSTRSSEFMCGSARSSLLLGDRLVINQGTLDFSIPLSAKAAQSEGYVPGSCMKTMGQHWMLDLSLRNGQLSWVEGNLLPVVPMYYPPTIDGTIHAIFITTPVAQPGAALFGHGDWETPALTASLMCEVRV